MKTVIKHFGSGLIAVLVTIVLLFLLFRGIRDGSGNVGILNMAGAEMDTVDMDYQSYQDFAFYQTEAAKAEPVISCSFPVITEGSTVKLDDSIIAINYAGNRLFITVTEITAPDGNSVMADMSPDTFITLHQAGCYTVYAYAVDDGNRRTDCKTCLLVNR